MKDEELDQEYEDEEEEVEERYSIGKLRRKLTNAMGKCDPKSEEYMVLSARLTEITECERNEKGWIASAGVQAVGELLKTAVQYYMSNKSVKRVLDYEDRGNILNTSSIKFLRRPRD